MSNENEEVILKPAYEALDAAKLSPQMRDRIKSQLSVRDGTIMVAVSDMNVGVSPEIEKFNPNELQIQRYRSMNELSDHFEGKSAEAAAPEPGKTEEGLSIARSPAEYLKLRADGVPLDGIHLDLPPGHTSS